MGGEGRGCLEAGSERFPRRCSLNQVLKRECAWGAGRCGGEGLVSSRFLGRSGEGHGATTRGQLSTRGLHPVREGEPRKEFQERQSQIRLSEAGWTGGSRREQITIRKGPCDLLPVSATGRIGGGGQAEDPAARG